MKMEKAANLLLKKMTEDKVFAERILAQTDRNKVIETAAEAGIDMKLEDIDEFNEIFAKITAPQNKGELSEEELESVAGGTGFILSILSAVISSATASGAFSAVMTLTL
jgi:predicted ribosomally synthesized peptide with nif11-like leader